MNNVLSLTKAWQKRSQYARYGRKEIQSFDDWYPERIQDMKRKGFDIRSKRINGTVMVGIQHGTEKPIITTEEKFLSELRNQYREEYLSQYGLNCEIGFEENVGIEVNV